MKFLIISSDNEVSSTLTEIIENNNFGEVVRDNRNLNACLLDNVDILVMDLLTYTKSFLRKLQSVTSSFKGKIILVSQTNDKETIARTYSLGAEYCIVKPIHRFEITEILKKVTRLLQLEGCLNNCGNVMGSSKL